MRQYVVVIEKAGKNYSAYLPDVPGCVATGRTKSAARRVLREALELHLEGLREDGRKPPVPHAVAQLVSI